MPALQLDEYLPTLEEASPAEAGRPLLLPLEQIDEDPAQPRSEFDPAALAELAASIALRGVLQPVSVRPHPDIAGRYMLNLGARRLRASRLAGKSQIRAFVDEMPDSYDQVIENEHREALRPMELALFVQRQLESGQSQAEVARRLGKSKAYICYVSALIDPPDWLTTAYREGKCRGVKELSDLRRLHEEHPEEVMRLIGEQECVSRADVESLREQLALEPLEAVAPVATPGVLGDAQVLVPNVASGGGGNAPSEVASRGRWGVYAEAAGRAVKIVLGTLPNAPDEIYVMEEGASSRKALKLSELRGVRLQRDQPAISFAAADLAAPMRPGTDQAPHGQGRAPTCDESSSQSPACQILQPSLRPRSSALRARKYAHKPRGSRRPLLPTALRSPH